MEANEATIPIKMKNKITDMMNVPNMEANINLKNSFITNGILVEY